MALALVPVRHEVDAEAKAGGFIEVVLVVLINHVQVPFKILLSSQVLLCCWVIFIKFGYVFLVSLCNIRN